MMDKNDIRHITAPRRGGYVDAITIREAPITRLVKQDISYERMAELSGKSVYEIRRYLGLIQ